MSLRKIRRKRICSTEHKPAKILWNFLISSEILKPLFPCWVLANFHSFFMMSDRVSIVRRLRITFGLDLSGNYCLNDFGFFEAVLWFYLVTTKNFFLTYLQVFSSHYQLTLSKFQVYTSSRNENFRSCWGVSSVEPTAYASRLFWGKSKNDEQTEYFYRTKRKRFLWNSFEKRSIEIGTTCWEVLAQHKQTAKISFFPNTPHPGTLWAKLALIWKKT